MNCRGLFWPAALILAAVAALSVDMPIARLMRAWSAPHTTHAWLGYFDHFEMFGHGLGIAVILFSLHQLDTRRRWAIPRVLACALAAGGVADLLKLLVLRVRPHDSDLTGSIWSTFAKWFPLLEGGSSGQGFPSAHTATAVGFVAALIWLYPQGRLLFSLLALMVACQRIACGAHYLSDTLIGAATGMLVAELFLYVGKLPRWFDRWEASWGRNT
jgi:membrane-associated phospholipid phosphatase